MYEKIGKKVTFEGQTDLLDPIETWVIVTLAARDCGRATG